MINQSCTIAGTVIYCWIGQYTYQSNIYFANNTFTNYLWALGSKMELRTMLLWRMLLWPFERTMLLWAWVPLQFWIHILMITFNLYFSCSRHFMPTIWWVRQGFKKRWVRRNNWGVFYNISIFQKLRKKTFSNFSEMCSFVVTDAHAQERLPVTSFEDVFSWLSSILNVLCSLVVFTYMFIKDV